jgi:hypothetical protein
MKQVYCQPYTKGRHISAYIGKPAKGIFEHDQIKIHLGNVPKDCTCGGNIYITADECADYIRALSAGLHHWILQNNKHIVKAKNKSEREEKQKRPQ